MQFQPYNVNKPIKNEGEPGNVSVRRVTKIKEKYTKIRKTYKNKRKKHKIIMSNGIMMMGKVDAKGRRRRMGSKKERGRDG